MRTAPILKALASAARQIKGAKTALAQARERLPRDSAELRLAVLPRALLEVERELLAVAQLVRREP